MRNISRQLNSFIAPVVMCIILPLAIVLSEHHYSLMISSSILQLLVGLIISLTGLILFIITTSTFIRIGKGTIMPWDPTRKLVVVGAYRYVRNPIILSVIILLVGEALFFGSYGIAVLAILFFVINSIYFNYSEEPGLEKRFGEEYREYKKNVPRWIPRWKPWDPS